MTDKDITAKSVKSVKCVDISLQSVGSSIKTLGGGEILFTRAILSIRNVCDYELVNAEVHALLGQEGGTVQDVSGILSKSLNTVISPGGTSSWDVYDVLIPAHPGAASKVHMFGYRAVLNWRFDLAVWAEYNISGSSDKMKTSVSKWALRWLVLDPASGEVELSIEEVKG